MAEKKLPSYRLVIGSKNVGTLWTAQSRDGKTNYYSGDIDVTSLKEAIKEKGTKVKTVRVNKEGATAEHDTIRVAMFTALMKKASSSNNDGW